MSKKKKSCLYEPAIERCSIYFHSHRCFLVSLVSEVSDGVVDVAFLLRILKKNDLRRASLPDRQLRIHHD